MGRLDEVVREGSGCNPGPVRGGRTRCARSKCSTRCANCRSACNTLMIALDNGTIGELWLCNSWQVPACESRRCALIRVAERPDATCRRTQATLITNRES